MAFLCLVVLKKLDRLSATGTLNLVDPFGLEEFLFFSWTSVHLFYPKSSLSLFFAYSRIIVSSILNLPSASTACGTLAGIIMICPSWTC